MKKEFQRYAARRAEQSKPRHSVAAPIRQIRDRSSSGGKEVRAELSPMARETLLAAIRDREAARLRKNKANNEEGKAYDKVEALMKEYKVKSVGGQIVIDDGKTRDTYDTAAKIVPTQKKTIDLDVLERLVDKKTWKKCLKAQVNLVEQHAGKNVVAQATTHTIGEPSLSIESKKVKSVPSPSLKKK